MIGSHFFKPFFKRHWHNHMYIETVIVFSNCSFPPYWLSKGDSNINPGKPNQVFFFQPGNKVGGNMKSLVCHKRCISLEDTHFI